MENWYVIMEHPMYMGISLWDTLYSWLWYCGTPNVGRCLCRCGTPYVGAYVIVVGMEKVGDLAARNRQCFWEIWGKKWGKGKKRENEEGKRKKWKRRGKGKREKGMWMNEKEGNGTHCEQWILRCIYQPSFRRADCVQHIYTNKSHCRSVCLSVCLFVPSNLLRLKSERHETRHVGPLGTPDGFRLNGFLNFDLKV